MPCSTPVRLLISTPGSGRLAQWLEHLVYTEEVGGSSPSPSTILRPLGYGWHAIFLPATGREMSSVLSAVASAKAEGPAKAGMTLYSAESYFRIHAGGFLPRGGKK